jgi:hypothetical protein
MGRRWQLEASVPEEAGRLLETEMVPAVDIPGKVRTGSGGHEHRHHHHEHHQHHEHRHHDGRRTMRRGVLTSRDLSEAERRGGPGFPGAPRSIEYPYAATYYFLHGGRRRDSPSIFFP